MRITVFAMLALATSLASADVYPCRAYRGNGYSGVATATCVAADTTAAVFVTNKHVARNARSMSVQAGGKWYQGVQLRLDPNDDVASFVIPNGAQFSPTLLIDDAPKDSAVQLCGFSKQRNGVCLTGRLKDEKHVVREDRLTIRPGDSGGAAFLHVGSQKFMVGLLQAYNNRKETVIVPADEVYDHLEDVFPNIPELLTFTGCFGNDRTYNYYGPQPQCPPVQQFQYQYPQPQYIEPVPAPQVIQQQPAPITVVPQPQAVQLPSDAMLDAAVARWMEINAERLRGPAGPAGRDGANGRDGVNGRDGESVSVRDIANYLMDNHLEDMRGQPGATGRRGIQGPRGPAGERGPRGRDSRIRVEVYDDEAAEPTRVLE